MAENIAEGFTVATQSNQQDTISKSMSEQIDKCLASVQK